MRALLGGLVIALLAVGCGGSENTGVPPPTAAAPDSGGKDNAGKPPAKRSLKPPPTNLDKPTMPK